MKPAFNEHKRTFHQGGIKYLTRQNGLAFSAIANNDGCQPIAVAPSAWENQLLPYGIGHKVSALAPGFLKSASVNFPTPIKQAL